MTDMVPVYVYERDIEAVWQFLSERNPVKGGKAATLKAAPQTAPQVTSSPAQDDVAPQQEDEEVFPQWPIQTTEEYYTMCQPVQRAILECVAEAGVKGTAIDVEEDVFAAAKAVWKGENKGGTFTRHNLTAAFTWLTKYSNKVSGGYWPFKDFKKDDGVWYFQMDPAMAKTILRLRDKLAADTQ